MTKTLGQIAWEKAISLTPELPVMCVWEGQPDSIKVIWEGAAAAVAKEWSAQFELLDDKTHPVTDILQRVKRIEARLEAMHPDRPAQTVVSLAQHSPGCECPKCTAMRTYPEGR